MDEEKENIADWTISLSLSLEGATKLISDSLFVVLFARNLSSLDYSWDYCDQIYHR